MGVRLRLLLLISVAVQLTACTLVDVEIPLIIGLLAPFEGRYREIGYNALYAARLAMTESGRDDLELLAVDDGGSLQTAIHRARALADDPRVLAVAVLGYDATAPDVQASFGDLPVIVVGNWLVKPQTDTVFILSSAEIPAMLTSTERLSVTEAARIAAPHVGGEVFALDGFRSIREDFDGITVVSSGTLPDADFTRRYLESDMFAVDPGLLATSTYDAVRLLVEVSSDNRAATTAALRTVAYTGINGTIQFVDQYWENAPVNRYEYTTAGELVQVD